ncbi:GLUG motif-containing protein [Anaerorhabdus furcosa]|uniref:The GLUG motif-containing protein n=1 Tax=Anaerorhabdus furcosa TaxID=118967 RepID=A0A1T4K9I6_9FIRM|nr:GLUG motif-containing protein [Anaerorhabdus furcosa]SJZ39114.1 The GLUG motif-containing protein [Anaerorhabdus furcosa]
MKKLFTLVLCLGMGLSLLSGCTTKKDEKANNEKTSEMIYDESKSYEETGSFDTGTITASEVTLKNVNFKGDLIIDEKVGEGNVTLDNVSIQGKLIVKGGGLNSIHVNNCVINEIEANKVNNPVRIVVSENTKVNQVTVMQNSNIEVNGEVNSINVKDTSSGSNVMVQPNAKVSTIEVNAPTSLHVQSPIGELSLKAQSTVKIEASIDIVKVSANAKNTDLTISKDVVVNSLATETKVGLSGEGKVTSVLTTDSTHITGDIKPDSIVVSANPIQDVTNNPISTPTPTASATPTVAPKPTITPTVVPTATPTPEVPASTPNPTTPPVDTAWDGQTIDTSWYSESSTTYTITTGAQFAGFGKLVNDGITFEGKTVNLGSDINLNKKEWTPIGYRYAKGGATLDGQDAGSNYKDYWFYYRTFLGTLNGNNHTISGLKCYNNGDTVNDGSALFGALGKATIKNVKFSNFEITGESRVAVVAAYSFGGSTFENIELIDGTVKAGIVYSDESWAAGGIVGQMWNYRHYNIANNNAVYSFIDCKVGSNVSIQGQSNVGGIWGSIVEATSKFSGSSTIDKNQFPYWEKDNVINTSGYDSTVFVKDCSNQGTVNATLVNAGSLAGWASVAEVKIESFENTGTVIIKDKEIENPKIISGSTVVETVPFYMSDKSAEVIVQTKQQLEQALANKKNSIKVRGIIGSDQDYKVYSINAATTIQGETGSEVYGSFILNADGIKISDLEIHNQGYLNETTPLLGKAAIWAISNQFTLENNTLVSNSNKQLSGLVSNGVVVYAGTDKATNVVINNNTIIGYQHENEDWSSSGIIVTAGLGFLDGMNNKKGATKTVNLTLDYATLAKSNSYQNCANDFIYSDYGHNTGWNTYRYYYGSNETGLLGGLQYAFPDEAIIEMATKNYSFNESNTHEDGENIFVVKANSELIIPSEASVRIEDDTELIIEVDAKLTGNVTYGKVNDKNINLPWNGTDIDVNWYDVNEEVYILRNAKELAGLAQLVNNGNTFQGKTVKLSNDIDLSNLNWTPIGTTEKHFMGTFDGNNKVISNLTCSNENSDLGTGLFGNMITPGVIKNVTINNAILTGKANVGAIIGSYSTGDIDNCAVQGHIEIVGNYKVGGLGGQGYGSVSNSRVDVDSSSFVRGIYLAANFEGDNVGGLVGFTGELNSSTYMIINCSSNVNVEGTRKVGGLVGFLSRGVGVKDSSSTGNVSSNALEDYITANNISIGGLIGEVLGTNEIFTILENCSATGTVTGPSADKVGALVGFLRDDATIVQLINCTWTVNSLSEIGNGHKIEGTDKYTRVSSDISQTTNLDMNNEVTLPVADEEEKELGESIIPEPVPSEEPVTTETPVSSETSIESEIEIKE